MSCLDVMYHTYGAHHPYFTTTPAYATHCPQTLSVYPRVQEVAMEVIPSSAPHPPAPSKEDALREKERPEAEYINSKCVLFTYFNGDISSVVDEHFTRALSNYNPETRSCKPRRGSTGSSEGPSSLTQRNFPASFWDSNYQAPPAPASASAASSSLSSPHSELHFASTESYPAALHPHLAQPPEHWHYPLGGPLSPQSSAYHHPRTIHELYPLNPNLDPRYSSLLVPALRSSRLQPAIAGQEPTSPWTGVFPTTEVTQTLNLNVDTGLQHHDKAKDVFWF